MWVSVAAVALLTALGAVALAGCGGESGVATQIPGTIQFEADPSGEPAYTADEMAVKAGHTTVDFKNPVLQQHDVEIMDATGEIIGETPLTSESSTSIEVELRAGEHRYFCTVPGHRDAGMEGILTVTVAGP